MDSSPPFWGEIVSCPSYYLEVFATRALIIKYFPNGVFRCYIGVPLQFQGRL